MPAHVWQLIADTPAGFPWLAVAGKVLTGWLVIDVDATLVTASSDKEGAAATWKKGYGFHPLGAWLASTREPPNIAADLAAWTHLLGCYDDELRDADPDTLRYRIWHIPARLARLARERILKISPSWPWRDAFLTCLERQCALPAPA